MNKLNGLFLNAALAFGAVAVAGTSAAMAQTAPASIEIVSSKPLPAVTVTMSSSVANGNQHQMAPVHPAKAQAPVVHPTPGKGEVMVSTQSSDPTVAPRDYIVPSQPEVLHPVAVVRSAATLPPTVTVGSSAPSQEPAK